MTSEKSKGLKLKSVVFYGIVVIALAVIGYFSLNLNKDSKTESLQTASSSNNEIIKVSTPIIDKTTNTPQETQANKEGNNVPPQESIKASDEPSQTIRTQETKSQSNSVQTPYQPTPAQKINENQPKNTPTKAQITQISAPKADPTVKTDNIAIKIAKNEVTGLLNFILINWMDYLWK